MIFTFRTESKSFVCDQLIRREAIMQFDDINVFWTESYMKQNKRCTANFGE